MRGCFSVTDSKQLDFLSIVASISPICNTKISTEDMVTNVACFDDVQERPSFPYNLHGACLECHTKLPSLIFLVCSAL